LTRKLPRSFYSRPTLRVARDLLGKYFIRRAGRFVFVGKIVEVEAYRGSIDPASHAYRGKTPRNEVMFGEAGHLYVYFTYGMHFCANVVTECPGKAGAVLLRALEPIRGLERMKLNRTTKGRSLDLFQLTNGPAKFCQAFSIVRNDNGTDLLGDRIYITEGEPVVDSEVSRSQRVGIRTGRDKKWRYFVKGNPWVSRQ